MSTISSIYGFAPPEGVLLAESDRPIRADSVGKSIADLQREWLELLVHQAFLAGSEKQESASHTSG